MEKNKTNDDDILVNNPRAINVAMFADARAAELKTMTEAIMTMGGMRRTFQKLPRHLRRRAMSHDLRRLPKRLRESEERGMKKSVAKKRSGPGTDDTGDAGPTPAKRSRRHSRRTGNLQQEYQRRQGNCMWLETHIWHAKRFKMVKCWGYKLAVHPSDKSARATYRAVSKHCLIQDVSYLRVIEITAPQNVILRGLGHLTSPLTGLTCAASSYIHGNRHGETMFYEKDRYPEGAIAPVGFLWRVCEGSGEEAGAGGSCDDKYGDESARQLWLWVHPASMETVSKELDKAFEEEESPISRPVTVRQLKDSPVRFRLQGPLSHPVLLDALKPADATSVGSEQTRKWWEYEANSPELKNQKEQSTLWSSLRGVETTALLPPRSVLGLVVRDPRNLLPIKKTKIMAASLPELSSTDPLPTSITRPSFSLSMCCSPIWEEAVRATVQSTQQPVHELNKMRSDLLVPGTELPLGRDESRIPILLLQHPGITPTVGAATAGHHRAGFGSGWDVVIPAGWGMAFWVSLIYRGARAAGLRESRRCHLQQGAFHFPEGFPDTEAGREAAAGTAQELLDKHRRWPPAKRPNYGKLGVPSPFDCPWHKLVEEWKENAKHAVDAQSCDSHPQTEQAPDITQQAFFVLRDKQKLQKLAEYLLGNPKSQRIKRQTRIKMEFPNNADSAIQREGSSVQTTDAPNDHHTREDPYQESLRCDLQEGAGRMLVGVHVTMVNRGVPGPFAMICLPLASDIASLAADGKYCPAEPIHGEFKLKRAAKKKKRKKKKSDKAQESGDERDDGIVDGKLLESCTRRIIGFITDGANTFISGGGRAVGYCCMLGLLEQRPRGRRMLALVRDTKTVQYRFAYVDIILT